MDFKVIELGKDFVSVGFGFGRWSVGWVSCFLVGIVDESFSDDDLV